MLLECSCGKKYLLRDDAANPPTQCPACGGILKIRSAAAPAAGAPDPRLKEIEARAQGLEREGSALRASVETKDRELQEAQAAIARLGTDLEKAQSTYKEALKNKDQEIEEKQRRISQLEGEGTKVRGQASAQTMALLKAKDVALEEARDRVSALEADLARSEKGVPAEVVEAKAGALSEVRQRVAALEAEKTEAQASIARLGEDLKKAQDAYKTALQNKDKEIEELHGRLASLERQLVEASGRAQGSGSPARAEPEAKGKDTERAQLRIAQLEKIVQDGERRYRDLQAEFDKLSAGASASSAQAETEKDLKLAQLGKDMSSRREVEVALRNQIREIEMSLQAEKSARRTLERSRETAARPKKLGEVRYLASDLDRSLASVSSSLAALVERVKRLQDGIQQTEQEMEQASSTAPEAESDVPAEEAKGEEVVRLEKLPEPAPVQGALPTDETMLDMGGMGRKGKPPTRPAIKPATAPPRSVEPATAEEVSEGAPLVTQPEEGRFEDVELSAETVPGPLPDDSEAAPEPGHEPPKKKGLFGKLFGRKK